MLTSYIMIHTCDANLVVDVAVGEHGVEVLNALLSVPVEVAVQALLYGAHVHRDLDDLVVVLKEKCVRRRLRKRLRVDIRHLRRC